MNVIKQTRPLQTFVSNGVHSPWGFNVLASKQSFIIDKTFARFYYLLMYPFVYSTPVRQTMFGYKKKNKRTRNCVLPITRTILVYSGQLRVPSIIVIVGYAIFFLFSDYSKIRLILLNGIHSCAITTEIYYLFFGIAPTLNHARRLSVA